MFNSRKKQSQDGAAYRIEASGKAVVCEMIWCCYSVSDKLLKLGILESYKYLLVFQIWSSKAL